MQLNSEQSQAVLVKDGPCLVLAGPGSGKTAVITNRLLVLIEKYGINPDNLLTITFTKAAALEMQSRFYKMSDSKYPEVTFGTFHSVFYQILRQAKDEKAPVFMKNYDAYRLTEHILKEENLKYSTESIRCLLRAMSAQKNGRNTEATNMVLSYANRFNDLAEHYDRLRKELNLIGFDDILPDCLELFRNNPQLLEKWRDRFRYIQVDEFQDVNCVQLEILQALAEPRNNLFAVGDDDQAIYAFRGSSPMSVLDFNKRFRSSRMIRLSVNYRSLPEIIQSSQKVIVRNEIRLKKESVPFRKSNAGVCTNVSLEFYKDEQNEKTALITALQKLIDCRNNTKSDETTSVAVLTRTNHQAAGLAVLLSENNIPFFMKEKAVALADSSQIQDICAYLRAGSGQIKRADFLRIMNKPVRFISREAATDSYMNRATLGRYYARAPYMRKTVEKLFRDLELIGRLPPAKAIGFIRKGIGYDRFCLTEMDAEEYAKTTDTLDLLQEKAAEYTDTAEFLSSIEAEKNRLSDMECSFSKKACCHEQIRLMTLHASKGLEFHTVFIPFLNEGVLPQRHAGSKEAKEEERRLLYVGMTRACDRLVLSCVQNDRKRISSFLSPLMG